MFWISFLNKISLDSLDFLINNLTSFLENHLPYRTGNPNLLEGKKEVYFLAFFLSGRLPVDFNSSDGADMKRRS